jgi:PKD repeat protein
VGFQATASGGDGHYNYTWDFGDGTSGVGATITHSYNSAGNYYAQVTATDGAGHSTNSASVLVKVHSVMSVSLSATPVLGQTPLSVTFTPIVSGGDGNYTYFYDYGDGSTGTSPNHTYNTAGTYVTNVTVSDGSGQTASSGDVSITVWAPMAVSNEATTATEGIGPLSVGFTATASGGDGNYTYTWHFGDGSLFVDGSTPSIASHTYSTPGIYYARVIVTDASSHTITGQDIAVHVYSPLSANAYATPTTLIVGNAVSVSAVASGGDGNYSWMMDFGDGSTGVSATSSHVYSSPGDYTITVTVMDGLGNSVSKTIGIHVLPVPPQIIAAKKLQAPFRIKLFGTNFHANLSATINGTPVTVSVKTSSKIVLKDIKPLVPRGVPVQIVVTNLDDGGVSNTFIFVRTPAQ